MSERIPVYYRDSGAYVRLDDHEALVADLEAEVKRLRAAAIELTSMKKAIRSTSKDSSVKKGYSLSGELLHYTVLPHVMHALESALRGGE